MNYLIKDEETNWYSVKEICDICNTSRQTWINFKNEFNCKTCFTVKRNLREGDKNIDYYPEDILKTFQAWLLRNQANQGRASDTIKSIVKAAVKNENYIYSAKEIWELSNSSSRSWDRFVAEFLTATDGEQKTDYLEEHPSRRGGNRYTEKTLKAFQAWLLRNQTNQGNSSDTIKSIVKAAVKNELTKTLSKDEIKLELARAKVLELQSQTEKQRLKTEQTKSITEREIALSKDKITILREKVEFVRQQNIKKALKIKNFTEPLKKEIKTMTNELAQQAVQAEYTKKLKQLDADGKYMLYIFHNPTNPTIYKIGKSNSLGNRLAIGTSENPNLQILYKKWCNCQLACDELEETIHQELREYNYNNYSDTGSKEWFVLTKEKLNEIVNKYEFVESI